MADGDRRIEDATSADLAAIVQLEAECYRPEQAYDMSLYAAALLDPAAVNLKLVEGTRLVGFGGAFVGSRGRRGHFYTLQVAPGLRGLGEGRRLMRAVHARLQAKGVRRVRLEVAVDNEAAQRLYESEGYRRRRRLRDYYDGPGARDAFVYVLRMPEGNSTPLGSN